MKSLQVHYMNKYPGGRVARGESSLDVYCAEGKHRVRLEKDGAGMWVDRSEENGCEDRHDLAPIPKDSRQWKLYADGRIAKAEEHAERAPKGKEYADKNGGKVPSEADLAQPKKA